MKAHPRLLGLVGSVCRQLRCCLCFELQITIINLVGGETFHPQRWQPLLLGFAQGVQITWVAWVIFLHLYQGGLTDDHVLILPIGHQASQVQKFLSLTSASQHCCQMDLTEEGEAEVSKFKSALKKMYKRQASSNGIPFFLIYGSVNYFNTTGKSAGVL